MYQFTIKHKNFSELGRILCTTKYSSIEHKQPLQLQISVDSVAIKALNYKPEGCGFETRTCEWLFLKSPNHLAAALGPGVHSAANRNEYHKQKNNVSGEYNAAVGLTTLPQSMSRLSMQCGILNISQPYRPPRPVMGIALLFLYISIPSSQAYRSIKLLGS
jgi:hypothetical protein